MGTPRRQRAVYDLGDVADIGAATAITVFHPTKDQAVLVVSPDLAAASARVRPQPGKSLYVVPSRWTSGPARWHLGSPALALAGLESLPAQTTAQLVDRMLAGGGGEQHC
jgi:hypothetical protein